MLDQMGAEIASESWFGSLRFSWGRVVKAEKPMVGILAFEVAGLMLKMVNLWNSLSERDMIRMREEIVNSTGVRRLVSEDDDYLMELALNEIIENLGYLATCVVRLGKRCSDPIYHNFERFFEDPLESGLRSFGYRWKKMERKMKKLDRFVSNTLQLSQELEVLADLEQTLRRMRANPELNQVRVLEFQQKVIWQRQEVKNLQDMSPWGRTYDYVVRLLARSLFTILERIKLVFSCDQMAFVEGNDNCEVRISALQLSNSHCLSRSHSFSALMYSSVHPSDHSDATPHGFHSGPLGRSVSKQKPTAGKTRTKMQHQQPVQHGNYSQLKAKRFSQIGPFKGCMTGVGGSPVLESCKSNIGGSMRLNSSSMKHMKDTHMASQSISSRIYTKLSLFSSKCSLLTASPSTLGGAALALHYANVIILIEKIASSPHLISVDARCDIYNMLTTSIQTTLRARLKSYPKTTASSVYNPALAEEWGLALEQIMEWLGPLAHNTIRWHSERNIVKQQEVSSSNVLLVQTLYFANWAKTEAAILELLIGLNYICMFDATNRRALRNAGGSRVYAECMLQRVETA
ncbi:protein PSK SIMULATOR 1-like [Argentina anserina]|uniref:protein PSK SIMULATOR 1-like n=1 Tax=Argentina anserina TaxID=57926 RepID=UPI0021767206|nr:protein PSK SIMULATOR 1-like [Potentilla anserina]